MSHDKAACIKCQKLFNASRWLECIDCRLRVCAQCKLKFKPTARTPGATKCSDCRVKMRKIVSNRGGDDIVI